MSKEMTIQENYSLQETIAAELFEGLTYPWEALPNIGAFIKKLGPTLPAEDYEQVGEDVWIARSATVAPTAYIHGPAIIGKEAEIRHCAFIRGNAIVGENAVVGTYGRRFHHLQCKIRQDTGGGKEWRRTDPYRL